MCLPSYYAKIFQTIWSLDFQIVKMEWCHANYRIVKLNLNNVYLMKNQEGFTFLWIDNQIETSNFCAFLIFREDQVYCLSRIDLKQKNSKTVSKTTNANRRNFNNLLPFEDHCQTIYNQSIGVRIDDLCNYKSFSQSCFSSNGETINVNQWYVSKDNSNKLCF